MISYPKIRQFKDVIREVKARVTYRGRDENGMPIYDGTIPAPVLTFVGTVKLHGTNASVVLGPGDSIQMQSRKRRLTPDHDNHGFARFITEEVGLDYWRRQTDRLRAKYGLSVDDTIVVYGEWCGGNIQKGVALQDVERMFVIFSLRAEIESDTYWLDIAELDMNHSRIKNVYEFEHHYLDIDFSNPGIARNKMVEFTLAVEERCPVAYALGSDGTGEGVVWKPIDPDYQEGKFWFKVKGDKHSVTKVKTLAPIDVEKAASLEEFVGKVVTEQRLMQGVEHLREMGMELSRRSTGDYLRWVFKDIAEEEADALEASCLTLKDIGKPVSTTARIWFFKYLDSELGL
jgi:hypothetical protein